METHADRGAPAMTEPGTQPEGIESERDAWLLNRLVQTALPTAKRETERHVRRLMAERDAARSEGAAQEYARIRAHLGLTYTDREVDDLLLAVRTSPPPPPPDHENPGREIKDVGW
jgi:hypothetical protein